MATTKITPELVEFQVRELRRAVGTNQASFDRRLSDLFDRVCKLEDLIRVHDEAVVSAPLPAQPPTEEQIVAALKADPAMAGRVMVALADGMWENDRLAMGREAEAACAGPSVSRGARGALQSLAVALAAASYRG